MKGKKRINLLLGLILAAGVGMLLYPTVSDKVTKWNLEQTISQYTQVVEGEQADYSQLWAEAEAYNRALAAQEEALLSVGELLPESTGLLDPQGNGMMGYLDVEKLDIHLPIWQGVEERELQSGVGWWIGTSLPTGGESTHCVLTAHTGLARAKLFSDLDQLELGDCFTLTILDRVMTYEVDQVLVTEPEDMEPLAIAEGEDYVTLYTCYPYGVNTQRLLVRGRRITDVETEAIVTAESSVTGQWVPVAGVGVALALLAAGTVRWIKWPRGKRERSKKG